MNRIHRSVDFLHIYPLEYKGGVQGSYVLFYSKRHEINGPTILVRTADTAGANRWIEIRNPWSEVPLSVKLNKYIFIISHIIYTTF